jgi:hypothetical protein
MLYPFVQGRRTYSPMPNPHLPPEIIDLIVDLLRDERGTLKQCCLVSKSWALRAQQHLFDEVEFECPADINTWKKTFPDPANSPGHHTRSLFIGCVEVLTVKDAGEGGWIQAFPNVVRLGMSNSGMGNIPPHSLLRLLNLFE